MKFRVKQNPPGLHPAPVAPHRHTDGEWYMPGEVLESPHDLREMFPEKFERMRDTAKVTLKEKPVTVIPPAPDEQDDEDLMVVDEERDGEDETPTKKEPAKAKVPAKKPADGMEDVTDKFPRAGEADLTVHHSVEEGFVVKDKDKTVSTERMTTKAKVNKFLKAHVGDSSDTTADDEE